MYMKNPCALVYTSGTGIFCLGDCVNNKNRLIGKSRFVYLCQYHPEIVCLSVPVNDKKANNFDWVAPVYDALAVAVFGRRLQWAQTVFLQNSTDAPIQAGASVLLVGGGTGWLLEYILRQCQPKRVVYLELSAQMVARASRRMVRHAVPGSVEFRVGDVTSLAANERFDVIITPFLLDLFTEQTLRERVLPPLRQALKPGGRWLVTDFVNPQAGWQKLLLRVMIAFFRLTAGIETRTLADWQRLLSESGLTQQKRQSHVGGMVSTEVWT